MRRICIALAVLICSAPAFAVTATQGNMPIYYGYIPINPALGFSGNAINSTSTWIADGFRPDANRTLNNALVYFGNKTGTLAAGDIIMEIYTDANGAPNTNVRLCYSTTTLNAYAVGENYFYQFQPDQGTCDLTAGNQYYALLRNTNGTPASNYVAPSEVSSNNEAMVVAGNQNTPGWCVKISTCSACTWASANFIGSDVMRVGYADGTYQGFPAKNATTAKTIYSTSTEQGVMFMSPSNVTLNVAGIVFGFRISGTPTGNVSYNLYTSSPPVTPIASTNQISSTSITTTASYVVAYFPTVQTIAPGLPVTITMTDNSTTDTISNFYFSYYYLFDSTANSIPLIPYGEQVMYFNGTSWTFTPYEAMPAALILDTNNPFTDPSTKTHGGSAQ